VCHIGDLIKCAGEHGIGGHGDGKVTNEGKLKKCILVKEGMRVEELGRMVKETVGG